MAAAVVTTILEKDGRVISLFHTIAALGTPQDVTLQELRIETSFPADAQTKHSCERSRPRLESPATMIVGDPKEIFPEERRIALIPASVVALGEIGSTVAAEAGAGYLWGYTDAAYEAKGATIAATVTTSSRARTRSSSGGSGRQPGRRQDLPASGPGRRAGFRRALGDAEAALELARTGATLFAIRCCPASARPDHGRAILDVHPARFSACCSPPPGLPSVPHDNDRRGHHRSGPGADPGHGRVRAGGNLHRTAHRRVVSASTWPRLKEQVQSLGAKFIELRWRRGTPRTREGTQGPGRNVLAAAADLMARAVARATSWSRRPTYPGAGRGFWSQPTWWRA